MLKLKRVVGTFSILIFWSLASHASNPFLEGDFVSVPGLNRIEVQKHELTYGQWAVLNPYLPEKHQNPWEAEDNPDIPGDENCYGKNHIKKAFGSNFPVGCISSKDVEAYIREANKPENQGTQKYVYRLPTVLELGKIVGMTLDSLEAGDGWVSNEVLQSNAWYKDNSGGQAREVCSTPAAKAGDLPLGLCDVLGNLWEWTGTFTRRRGGFDLFVRGGGWYDNARELQLAANSDPEKPSLRWAGLGVRLVRTPKK